MKSVNYALRKAYVSSLNGLTLNSNPVPVYYMEAPEDETSPAYVLLVSPSNVDVSTKDSSDTNTSMQVQIRTWAENGNAGKVADDLANDVYTAIYPNTHTVLDLSADGLQMVSTKMQNDSVNTISGHGNRTFVTRIITFTHNIYHK